MLSKGLYSRQGLKDINQWTVIMGKKKTNIKKLKRKQHQKLLSMSCKQLMDKGIQALSSLKGKDAVNLFKLALKQSGETLEDERIKSYLMRAYLIRVQELRQKQMMVEAQTIQKQALEHMPDPIHMDEESMLAVFNLCDLNRALEIFNQFLKKNGKSDKLERGLADRLVVENSWDKLDILDKSMQLVKDATTMEQATNLMDKGKWEEARKVLKSLPRSSPFAHVRMFCRAMTSFYSDNDWALKKAISMIPENSIFKRIAAPLQKQPGPGDVIKNNSEMARLINCVWQGPIDIFTRVEDLLALVKKNKCDANIKKAIQALSACLLPNNKKSAQKFILETIYSPGLGENYTFFKIAASIDRKLSEMIKIKTQLLFMPSPLEAAVAYYDSLAKEFTEPGEIAMAKAMIIYHILHCVSNNHYSLFLGNHGDETIQRLGISTRTDIDTALLEMAAFGISIDPKNKKLLELAAGLPCRSRPSKKIKEQILISMCDCFPQDPFPCLELSDLYHGKNAYRKAENILEKAMKIAPYDTKVLDRHAISLLISADRNLAKRNFQLLWHDFEKAKNLNSKTNEVLIQEKKLFYKICEIPRHWDKTQKLMLDSLPVFSRLQILSLMIHDLTRKKVLEKEKISQIIGQVFLSELSAIEKLSSSEILRLLLPVPFEWRYLFGTSSMTKLFYDRSDKILTHLQDSDLLTLIDQALFPGLYEPFVYELIERINETTDNNEDIDPLMDFYFTAIESLEDGKWISEDFLEIVEDVDPGTEKKMKEAAIRFSKHTHGRAKAALETFNFQLLEDSLDFPFNFGLDDDNIFSDEGDEFNPFDSPFGPNLPDLGDLMSGEFFKGTSRDSEQRTNSREENLMGDMLGDMLGDMVGCMESIIESERLRGASKTDLQNARKRLMKDETYKMIAHIIKSMYKTKAEKILSREAKAIFIE
jgi:tetratricopeptide (TPR) repeat protein